MLPAGVMLTSLLPAAGVNEDDAVDQDGARLTGVQMQLDVRCRTCSSRRRRRRTRSSWRTGQARGVQVKPDAGGDVQVQLAHRQQRDVRTGSPRRRRDVQAQLDIHEQRGGM